MAIVIDSSNSAKGTAVSTLTTPAWTAAGSDRLLLAGMGWSAEIPPTYSEMRWDGSGGTLLTQQGSTVATSFHRGAMASLVAPATGSRTLYGLVSGTADEICVGGATWTGVHQSVPLGAVATAFDDQPATVTPSVTVTALSGDVVQDMMYSATATGGTTTKDASQTLIWQQDDIGTSPVLNAGGESYEAAVGDTVMSWTTPNAANDGWVILGVAIKAAAAAAAAIILLGQACL